MFILRKRTHINIINQSSFKSNIPKKHHSKLYGPYTSTIPTQHKKKTPAKNQLTHLLLSHRTWSFLANMQILGFGFFASVTGVFCYSGLVRGFFATVGVGGFLRQCCDGFLRQWKGFWLRQGGFFASVVVFCDGKRGLLRRRRSTAERSIKKTSSRATVKQ